MEKGHNKTFIIETAFSLFLNKGYRNTSMSDLVKATKLSKGAFYYHFKNKEKLYMDVIDLYFLSYYKKIDWRESENLNIKEIENLMKKFYSIFVPDIMKTTGKGMSRYFILFFEAYEIHPLFKETVNDFYKRLKKLLTKRFLNEKVENPEIEAIKMINKYEGLLFWFAINPNENVTQLINDI